MSYIKIKNIIKKDKKILFHIEQSGLENYFNELEQYYEYPISIDNVPNSIAIIPLLGNLLPIVFLFDVDCYIDELDKAFYNAIPNIRMAFKENIPNYCFGGNIIVKNIVENHSKNISNHNALLFSGGVDALNSLVKHYDKVSSLISIWGSDISDVNDTGWNKLKGVISKQATEFNKDLFVIKSNFRKLYNENNLTIYIYKTLLDNWWHAFQHGPALITQAAPLTYLLGFKTLYIASTYTKDFNPICASNPITDQAFKFADTSVIHDGFEYNRCDKIKNIYEYLENHNMSLMVHVCYKDTSGTNCCKCEKCLRTILSCWGIGKDPALIGLGNYPTMRYIKSFYKHKLIYGKDTLYFLDCVKIYLKNTYRDGVPKEFKWIIETKFERINNSLYWRIKKVLVNIKYTLKKLVRK